eukprot:3098747-Rhodomonas_salina.1
MHHACSRLYAHARDMCVMTPYPRYPPQYPADHVPLASHTARHSLPCIAFAMRTRQVWPRSTIRSGSTGHGLGGA